MFSKLVQNLFIALRVQVNLHRHLSPVYNPELFGQPTQMLFQGIPTLSREDLPVACFFQIQDDC